MFLFQKRKPMIDEASQQQIVACIREVESRTTGEVRVYVEHKCTYMNAMDRAKEIFFNLSMEKTSGHNGVLVYLALKDKQYAIYGDAAIHEKGNQDELWKTVAKLLREHLSNNNIAQAVCACLGEIGVALAKHFPYDATVAKNELPDEIVFGK